MHHPDKNNGDPESLRIMKNINSSYDVLSNPTTRAEYDDWVRAHRQA